MHLAMTSSPTSLAKRQSAAVVNVVGIGASAGGLEALEQFFARVPVRSGLAYIVVQHLDPTQKAMLAELLQRVTSRRVRETCEQMRVAADHVYVILRNAELSLTEGTLHVIPPANPAACDCQSMSCSQPSPATWVLRPSVSCCRAWDRKGR